MLSTLDLVFDINYDTKAINLEELINPKSGNEVKIYIPTLMQFIEKGEPEESPAGLDVNCFVCEEVPAINEEVEKRNYFIGILQNNSTSVDIINKTEEEGKILRTFIEKDAELRCMFKNGKLSQLMVNTDINADNTMTDFHFFHFNNEGGYGGTYIPSPYKHNNPDANVNPNKGRQGTKVNTNAGVTTKTVSPPLRSVRGGRYTT